MGTRNLTIVKHEGKYKLSQYGQWDGYPSGQGKTILNFIRVIDKNKFLKNLDLLKLITKKEHKKILKECGNDVDDGFINSEVAKKRERLYPELSRNTGADILQMIQDNKLTYSDPDLNFIKDSLFCEWAYVIDFDKNTFEVFKGFNTTKLDSKERFFEFQEEEKELEYYPCKLLASFKLSELPTNKKFLELEKEEDD